MAYVSFYDGSRSISMGSKNTWSDWHLIPDGMPLVEPPPIKSNKGDYVDVPGAHGSLDYTGILSGIKYGDREGSWTFSLIQTMEPQQSDIVKFCLQSMV